MASILEKVMLALEELELHPPEKPLAMLLTMECGALLAILKRKW